MTVKQRSHSSLSFSALTDRQAHRASVDASFLEPDHGLVALTLAGCRQSLASHFRQDSTVSAIGSKQLPPTPGLLRRPVEMYHRMRRKSRNEALKLSTSMSNLLVECSNDSEAGQSTANVRQSSSTVTAPARRPRVIDRTRCQAIFVSVAFRPPKRTPSGGSESYLPTLPFRRTLPLPRIKYRCVLFASDWATGSPWTQVGVSEAITITAADDAELQFAFVTPFEVPYFYDADTMLKFELQRAKGIEKSATLTSLHILPMSIDKARKNRGASEGPSTDDFHPLCSFSTDLNGLVHRGAVQAPMQGTCAMDCFIYLAAEPATDPQSSSTYAIRNVNFSCAQLFDSNDNRLFFGGTSYRMLISRFFNDKVGFVPVYKSQPFLPVYTAKVFQADLEGLLSTNTETVFRRNALLRFAVIEANTEKLRCFGDIRFDPATCMQLLDVMITETNLQSAMPSPAKSSVFRRPAFGVFRIFFHVPESPPQVSTQTAESSQRSSTSSYSDDSKATKAHPSSGEEDYGDDVLIVNGHTQAYLMGLLIPNKRILVRETYPDHEVICEPLR